jgi:hypothetical protein
MSKHPLSISLQGAIEDLERSALRLSDRVTNPLLKSRLGVALDELDEIPDLFECEDKMRQALALPCARIRQVASIVDQHGPHAVFLPDD